MSSSTKLTKEQRAARTEDLHWMAETGESLQGAADRIGIDRDSLAKWMDLNGLRDLKNRMAARELHEHNTAIPKHGNRIYARHRRAA